MKSFSRIVLRNSAFGLIAQLLIKIISFAFSVFVVRKLGAETFGQYSAVLAFCTTLAFIGDLGLSPYLVREIARLRNKPGGFEQAQQLYSDVLLLRILLSILSAVLVVITAIITHRPWVMIGGILINSISLVLYGIHGTADAVLAGFERLDISSSAKIVYQILFVSLGTGVLIFKLGYYGLVTANVLGVGLMAFVAWQATRVLGIHLRMPSPKVWLHLLRSCLPFGILAFALGFSYKFDSILLNIVRGDVENGYYAAAYNLVFSCVLISNVVNTALYPSLSRQSVADPESLKRIYEKVFRYLLLISLPISVGIWAVSKELINLLYSTDYQQSIPILKIIIWVVPFMFISEFLGYIVTIDNKERLVARSVLISTILNVIANLIFIPRFGYFAAAFMTVITEIILVFQYIWILRKKLSEINWKRGILRPLFAALLMGAVLIIVSPWFSLLGMIATGGFTYILFAFLFGAVQEEDFFLIKTWRSERKPVFK
jgi:O-antigen/teichoic acid export membrane protein